MFAFVAVDVVAMGLFFYNFEFGCFVVVSSTEFCMTKICEIFNVTLRGALSLSSLDSANI